MFWSVFSEALQCFCTKNKISYSPFVSYSVFVQKNKKSYSPFVSYRRQNIYVEKLGKLLKQAYV